MKEQTFVRKSSLPVPAKTAFEWHARPGALERLTPPWSPVLVERRTGGIEAGARVVLRIPFGPLGFRWVAEHVEYEEGRLFRDVQVSGPFARWDHLHTIEPSGSRECQLEDRITYALPLGALGNTIAGSAIRRSLARMFGFRHRTTLGDLQAHATLSRRPLSIAVIGRGGLLEPTLCAFLSTGGHLLRRVSLEGPVGRSDDGRAEKGVSVLESDQLDGVDAVVCLGETIAGTGRPRRARNARALEKRVNDSHALARVIANMRRPPGVLVCASGLGFYGSRGYERLDEDASPGTGIVSQAARRCEEAAEPARAAGVRVVHLRLGTVLTSAASVPGSPRRRARVDRVSRHAGSRPFVSWIGLDDVLGAILHVIVKEAIEGPVNVVAPSAVTTGELVRTLAAVSMRPYWISVLGRAAPSLSYVPTDGAAIAGVRVTAAKLIESGFRFRAPELETGLRHTLGAWPDDLEPRSGRS